MNFVKMQGTGNDYIYLDCRSGLPPKLPALVRRLSDRHFGVGGDGVICICPSDTADVAMRMFNADGSEGEMCGNGIRCVGKYVYEMGLVPKSRLTVETRAGIKTLELHIDGADVTGVTVDMGVPKVALPRTVCIRGTPYQITPVDMGNPHAVLFLDGIEGLDLPGIGPEFEHHPSFPHRTNTEFVAVLAWDRLQMRVWERGSGETLACGTGACAALAAAASDGRTGREAVVQLRGGDLRLRWAEDGHMYLTGPAVTVCKGVYEDGKD